jgi:serine/threonine protein kinase
MAQVFRAYDQRDGRCVVLKVPLPKWQSDALFEQVFEHEIQIAQRLSHPNLVSVLEAGRIDRRLYLAMEVVEGVTLEDILFHGPIRLSECLFLARQLTAALYYAHRQGLVHGDVKPANLMVTSRGFLKILDFGVAAQTEALKNSSYTLGTPPYMAPEVLREGVATAFSDQYAVGVVLYECLTGRLPFGGYENAEVAFNQIHAPIPSLVSLRRGLPAAWELLVLKMLAKEPEKRFSNLGYVHEKLMRSETGWS